MLHIVNGLATLNLLDRTDIRGARVSGDDIFAEGPVQDCLETPGSWRARAEYLQRRFGIPKEQYLQRKEERERSLRSFAYHEEVVLWFEFDLFCQLNLLFLLHWFANRNLGNTKLSLICPGEFPGIKRFRGLGALSPKQLASLFEEREEVTEQQKKLAEKAWSAYSSPDPTAIEQLLEEDTGALHHLRQALYAHLERFPSTVNGLNSVEFKILDTVNDGTRKFVDLFNAINSSENMLFHGMGDLQFSVYLIELASGDCPVLRMENFPGILNQDVDRKSLSKCTVRITDLGKEVLKGRQDNVEVRGVDRWLGGTHVKSPDAVWRWDPANRRLVAPAGPATQERRGDVSIA